MTVEYTDPTIQQQFSQRGSGGKLTTNVSIEIFDKEITSFSYPSDFYVFNIRDNVNIAVNDVVGGTPTSFSIVGEDSLPSGVTDKIGSPF